MGRQVPSIASRALSRSEPDRRRVARDGVPPRSPSVAPGFSRGDDRQLQEDEYHD
jgi:hypothetical protein